MTTDMQGIGDNVRAVRRVRLKAPLSRADDMTEVGSFGENPGELGMLVYVPAEMAKNAPLVVVLHGCTQTAEAHADAAGWLDLAARCGFAVLAPEQRRSNNPNRCFNWYEPGDTARDSGEAASIRAMIAHMVAVYKLDADRVFITGLSAGGAMTSAMLAAYPEVFAGGAIIAGLPYGAADNLQSAFGAMRGRGLGASPDGGALLSNAGGRTPRVTVWHGDADYTVSAGNAGQIARQWVSAHSLAFDVSDSETLGRRERTMWRAPQTGEILVEANIVRGLGHGTPLSTLGEGAVGSVAPYMLEAEISAVTEIARFWALAHPDMLASVQINVGDETMSETPTLGHSIMASLTGRVSQDVETVIADALKQAGLMR